MPDRRGYSLHEFSGQMARFREKKETDLFDVRSGRDVNVEVGVLLVEA